MKDLNYNTFFLGGSFLAMRLMAVSKAYKKGTIDK